MFRAVDSDVDHKLHFEVLDSDFGGDEHVRTFRQFFPVSSSLANPFEIWTANERTKMLSSHKIGRSDRL
jgi:hypothetical protein